MAVPIAIFPIATEFNYSVDNLTCDDVAKFFATQGLTVAEADDILAFALQWLYDMRNVPGPEAEAATPICQELFNSLTQNQAHRQVPPLAGSPVWWTPPANMQETGGYRPNDTVTTVSHSMTPTRATRPLTARLDRHAGHQDGALDESQVSDGSDVDPYENDLDMRDVPILAYVSGVPGWEPPNAQSIASTPGPSSVEPPPPPSLLQEDSGMLSPPHTSVTADPPHEL